MDQCDATNASALPWRRSNLPRRHSAPPCSDHPSCLVPAWHGSRNWEIRKHAWLSAVVVHLLVILLLWMFLPVITLLPLSSCLCKLRGLSPSYVSGYSGLTVNYLGALNAHQEKLPLRGSIAIQHSSPESSSHTTQTTSTALSRDLFIPTSILANHIPCPQAQWQPPPQILQC